MASLVDGTLPADERAAAERHMAECVDCYEEFVESVRLRRELGEPEVARPVFGRRRSSRVWPYAAGLAAAAVVALVLLPPAALVRWLSPGSRPELAELVDAAGAYRTTDARLTGGFAWGDVAGVTRGADAASMPELQIASGRIDQALQRNRTARTLAAHATARLLAREPDEAITALEEATTLERETAFLWSDLAAAYLTRSARPDRSVDLPYALNAVETALKLDDRLPEAWFNRALIAERLSMVPAARESWNRFLALDASSPWADEARRRLAALDRPRIAERPDAQPLRDRLYDIVLPAWGRAVVAGDPGAATHLAEAKALVSEQAPLSPDPFAADVVAGIDRQRPGSPALTQLAQGHATYGQARALYDDAAFSAAAPLFAMSRLDLAAGGSQLAGFARLHESLIAYRQQQYAAATALGVEIQSAIAGRGYVALEGRAEWIVGLSSAQLGDFRTSMYRYRNAIDRMHVAAQSQHEAFLYGLLSTAYDFLGDPVRAWAARETALRGSQREGTFLAAAVAATRLELHRTAALLEDASIAIAAAAGRAPTMADSLRSRAATAAILGEDAKVPAILAEAERLASAGRDAGWDRLRAEIDLARAQVASGDTARDGAAAATRALEHFAKSPARHPEIYVVRARLRRSLGDATGALQDLRSGLDALDRQRATVKPGVDQSTFADIMRRLADEFADLSVDQGRPADAFAVLEETRGRDLNLPAAAGPVTPESLAAQVPEGTTVLTYVVGERRTLIWSLRQRAVSLQISPVGRAELSRLVLAAGSPRFDTSAAAALRAHLLAPVDAVVRVDDLLVIVPDGPLHTLPFAALPGRRAPYLVEEHPLVVAPSAGAWETLSSRVTRDARRPLTIFAAGDPGIDRDVFPWLEPLAMAAGEARDVAQFYANPIVVTGRDVTRRRLEGALASAGVVHFAGHAVVNHTNPAYSTLVIADDAGSGLAAGDIRVLTNRAQLVVLAACQGTAGMLTRSDGPLGLARAFLASGVPTVVASHWVVDDAVSPQLFVPFHKMFATTGDAARSLQQAQRALLNSSDARVRHPANWAGITVIGGVRLTSN